MKNIEKFVRECLYYAFNDPLTSLTKIQAGQYVYSKTRDHPQYSTWCTESIKVLSDSAIKKLSRKKYIYALKLTGDSGKPEYYYMKRPEDQEQCCHV